jgi:hypothetical protein
MGQRWAAIMQDVNSILCVKPSNTVLAWLLWQLCCVEV